MGTQMNAAEARRFAWAVMLATIVAASAIVFADGVYMSDAPFRKWCETASNTMYILAGCWRY
jgi:hypothetical protein